MICADNFKFYRNGKLIQCPDEQFTVATNEELHWLDDSIVVKFELNRLDGSWGDEFGIIPSDTAPGRLPPYIIFHRPRGNICQGDRIFSDKTCIRQVKKAVYRYLGEESQECFAIFAYL